MPSAPRGPRPCDREVIEAVGTALRRTRRFGDVLVGRDDQVDRILGGRGNLCVIVPPRPEAIRQDPEPNPRRKLRTIGYQVVIKLVHGNPDVAYQELDALVNVAVNALQGVAPTPYCLAERCVAQVVGIEANEPPTYIGGLRCEAAYVVDESDGLED